MNCKVLTTTLFALLTASAYGQSRTMLEANIPFAFHVGETSFAAGKYEVSKEGPTGLLRIHSAYPKGPGAFIMTQGVITRTIPSRGTLLFHRYGDTYFLSQVWTTGEDTGRQLRPSKAEREMAKAGPPMPAVSVSASLR